MIQQNIQGSVVEAAAVEEDDKNHEVTSQEGADHESMQIGNQERALENEIEKGSD